MVDMLDDDDSSVHGRPNKSQLKREAQAFLDLAKKIIELSESRWPDLLLPEEIINELQHLKDTPQHVARKRQLKHVAKLLRGVDVAAAKEVVDASNHERVESNAVFHRVELWRERLLSEQGSGVLTEFLDLYPGADVQHLNQLIRNSKLEMAKGKTVKTPKLLFKYLRELID